MNFRFFRHFSVQNLFPWGIISIQYPSKIPLSTQKKTVLPKTCNSPTCYTKVPKLAPLVDVQRIPKFGYLSQTTGCDMTHPGGNPSLNDGGKPPSGRSCWGALGLKRIQHLLLSSVAWWVGQWWEWLGLGMGYWRILFFSIFFLIFPKKTNQMSSGNTIFLPTLASFLVTRNIYIYTFPCLLSHLFFQPNPWFFPTSTASNGAWA